MFHRQPKPASQQLAAIIRVRDTNGNQLTVIDTWRPAGGWLGRLGLAAVSGSRPAKRSSRQRRTSSSSWKASRPLSGEGSIRLETFSRRTFATGAAVPTPAGLFQSMDLNSG
jgi:hypothetical protein